MTNIVAEWRPGFTGVATETLLHVRRSSTGSRISKVELQEYLYEVGMYAATQLKRVGNVLTLRLLWMGEWFSYDLSEVDSGSFYTSPVQLGLGTHLILL